ncbi:hypothetical protein B0H11DRAFT_2199507 [Mycena galericulata]|nr:hypothetical protein B0H11DRAFT_2199507 [Mycena galericulata]
MSAEELQVQALIEDISADIERQEGVLRQLRSNKCAAQRRLNSLRDPVARLPLEVSSSIFVNCLDRFPTSGARHAPMLFLNVCGAWTSIALSTPELWTRIQLGDGPAADLPRPVDMWFERAGSHALSISGMASYGGADDTLQVIKSYASRLQDLQTNFGTLERLLVDGVFPALKILTLTGVYTTSDVLGILRVLPHLVECTFYDLFDADRESDMLVLPRMQHLTIQSGSGDDILKYLTLPGLKTLSLPWQHILSANLFNFLNRSSPPLVRLCLGSHWRIQEGTFDEVEECFSLLPMLTHLELSNPEPATAALVVTILANSPHLLPNLTSLAFNFRELFPESSWYEKVLTALSVRHSKLAFACLLLEPSQDSKGIEMDATVLGGLRQLVAGGMKIHIGTEEQNLV